jgi:sulfur relay (sulfurtransferase) complex TusBCD TusD component (DsrE family)
LKTLIEVFRNVPAGRGCLNLTKNVLDVVYGGSIDYEINEKMDIVTDDFEVHIYPFPSRTAEERGIEGAPSICINRKLKVYGVVSPEEIKGLIEKAKPVKIGIIITKTPNANEDVENVLTLGEEALKAGNQVELFLLSDGVWVGKKGNALAEERLINLINDGCKVKASRRHLKAFGLNKDKLVEGVNTSDDPYDELVDLVMEKWDKVVIF